MKTASVSYLKSELGTMSSAELRDVCLKLARYKTENKDLLTYLLFYKEDEAGYILSVKGAIDALFLDYNATQLYFVRKTIRKILRVTNKYIRFSGNKQTEVELRLHFCNRLRYSGIPLDPGSSLGNLYTGQLQKIVKCLPLLHEDLQYDYQREIEKLELK